MYLRASEMKPYIYFFLFLGFLIIKSGFVAGQSISVSHPSGRHDSPFFLKLDCEAELRYTLGGNTPGPSSELFPDSLPIGFVIPENNYCLIPTNAIEYNTKNWRNREFGWRPPLNEIDKLQVLRVRGFKEGRAVTELLTLVYQINPIIGKLPIVAITTDSSNLFDQEIGIYVPGINYDSENPNNSGNFCMRGVMWERPASIHYFLPDGSLGFTQEVGIRIHGGATRIWPQKSLRVYARRNYGKDSFTYPFFGENAPQEFKRIILRSSMSHWHERNTVFQDEYLQKLIGSFYPDMDVQLSRPAQLFINGESWGMVAIKERADEYYLSSHYNIPVDEILFIEPTVDRIEEFDRILQFCRHQYLEDDFNYQQIEEWLDVRNYARYILLELFMANLDWPHNNSKAWKPRSEEGKWKWILFDLDAGLGRTREKSIATLVDSETPLGTIFNALIQNDDFVELLQNEWIRMRDQLFIPDRIGPLLASFIEEYEPGLEAQIQRWQNPSSKTKWENNINEMISFLLERPRIFDQQLKEFFSWPDDDNEIGVFDVKLHWNLYPNPVHSIFTIESDIFIQSNWTVQLLSYQGKIIMEKMSEGQSRVQFQVENLPAGLYLVRIYSNVYQASFQVIKLHL